MRVTRRYRFAASHRLHSATFSEDENRELYGKCSNPYGHGHDYLLEVTVAGPVDAASGHVIHVPTLDRLVSEQVLKDFDHRYLNADVAEFQTRVPTSEHIIRIIEDRLSLRWQEVFPGEWPRLDGIRLRETKRNVFELKT
ncbi:MAG TPA: 6-carboxytetrahydropterin synthase [Candidatus Sulfotelmatobacter sp.]|nr:6-carboxytetrahydropterin synthase [Candidatus Sulfotelmatobacter sp.]